MAGPTCEVVPGPVPTGEMLDIVDSYLATTAQELIRHRKGRYWRVWIDGRPVEITAQEGDEGSPDLLVIAAGCNSAQDHTLLKRMGNELAALLHGRATEPAK